MNSMTDEQSKALDYIEDIIAAMRECSFKCKEFCILICSAFLTIFATVNPNPNLMVILCAPVILLFWIIDSCYLNKERAFRKEYTRIVKMTSQDLQERNPLLFSARSTPKDFFGCMLKSFSTWPIYLPLLAASISFGIVLLVK